MANEQTVFRFDLNESLYFESGQEVDEIRGISLEPEISIQPFNDYISIRGVIELQGEYTKVNEIPTDDNIEDDADDFQAKRYVEQVDSGENGEMQFSHRFPVEISVPSYRVSNLDDVMVYIESFDYELSHRNHLNFTSTIEIHGIAEQEETQEVDERPTSLANETDHLFEFDVTEADEIEQDSSHIKDVNETLDLPTLSDEPKAPTEEKSPDRLKGKKAQTLSEFFNKKAEESSSSGSEDELDQDWVSEADDGVDNSDDEWESSETESTWQAPEDVIENENMTSETDPSIESEIVNEQDRVDGPAVNETGENANQDEVMDVGYLSDMFRHDDEHFSRMRVCIVQEHDTLATIANRYAISEGQLMKRNRMDDEMVSHGQLLYIPERKN